MARYVSDELRHLRSMLDDLRMDVRNGTWNGDSSAKLRACIDTTNACLDMVVGSHPYEVDPLAPVVCGSGPGLEPGYATKSLPFPEYLKGG